MALAGMFGTGIKSSDGYRCVCLAHHSFSLSALSASNPCRERTYNTASMRDDTPSLLNILVKWPSTVRTLIDNASAMYLLRCPRAARLSTSCSRSDKIAELSWAGCVFLDAQSRAIVAHIFGWRTVSPAYM